MGDVRIHCGDALDVLRGMEAGSFDAVVTDPPYGIAYATNRVQGGKAASWRGKMIASDEDASVRDAVLAEARRRGVPWACFGSWKVAKPEGIRGVLVWDKGPAFGMGDLSFPWKMSWEEIYIGGPGWTGHRDEGVLRGHLVVSWESRGRCHPNEKPVSLMREIIRKLPPHLVILDPFAGSGTTGVACLQTGRRCILIEKEPACVEVINRRLADARGESGLFAPGLFDEPREG